LATSDLVGIITFVKKNQALAFLLAFMTLMPLIVLTVSSVGAAGLDGYELCENSEEQEEHNNERNSEEKEAKSATEVYLLHRQIKIAAQRSQGLDYIARCKALSIVSNDVLTPPPEFI